MNRQGGDLRVLQITGEYPPMEGGVADYTRLLAEHLIALDVRVAVLTDTRGKGKGERGKGEAEPVVYARVGSWGFRCWREVDWALAAFEPDVVHVQYQTGAYGMRPAINLLPYWLRRWAQRPAIVVTFHDLRTPYLFPKAGRLRSIVNQTLAASADAVTATNVEDERALRQAVPERLVRTIPIPPNVPAVTLDDAEWRHLRASLGLGDAVAAVGYFGLINQSKGLSTLLEAIRRLRGDGVAVDLVMVGGGVGATDPTNTAELAQVRGLVRQLGLDHAVHWTGWLAPPDASRALAACDAVALPYRDGASVRRATLLAALANGLPTVTTAPATPEALAVPDQPERRIASGVEALLVPTDDPAALAGALRQALFDVTCRGRLSQSARAFAAAFTWERVAGLTLDLYRTVRSSPSGKQA